MRNYYFKETELENNSTLREWIFENGNIKNKEIFFKNKFVFGLYNNEDDSLCQLSSWKSSAIKHGVTIYFSYN